MIVSVGSSGHTKREARLEFEAAGRCFTGCAQSSHIARMDVEKIKPMQPINIREQHLHLWLAGHFIKSRCIHETLIICTQTLLMNCNLKDTVG